VVAVATQEDKGLIRNMEPEDIYKTYLRYIGAGAVAAGGIISMLRAMRLSSPRSWPESATSALPPGRGYLDGPHRTGPAD